MRILSQYFTWIDISDRAKPIKPMRENSIVTLLHLDPMEIDSGLQDIAKLFQECIECDRANTRLLKENLILMQYEFAPTMPFFRGSASIGELLLGVIGHYHGLTLTYNPDTMVDVEAMTSSLPEFAQNYDSIVSVQPTPSV